ncbi:DUF3854 domain-containing protein [Xanthomonas citri pv. punicae]|nr:DUF3854 domain-containing protein [Xanthomonas citri pv. punicae]
MVKLMRKTRLQDWYEYYRTPCPICGHTGGCMGHKDGEVVACIRVASEKYFSKNSALPSYLHFLKGKAKRKINNDEVAEFTQGNEKKEAVTLDTVYQAFLESLKLDDNHYNHLISDERQLSDKQVMIRNYRSFPEKPWNTVKQITEITGMEDFAGIPGFYQYKNFWTIAGMKGILIPFRNHYNQIVGFQYRIDNPPNVAEVKVNGTNLRAKVLSQPNTIQVTNQGEVISELEIPVSKEWTTISHNNEILGWVRVVKGNRYFWLSSANKENGTGSGNPAPLHISVPSSKLINWEPGTLHKAKTAWLGEGPLKCDIAVDCMEKLYDPLELEDIGTTFVALPGVGAWRLAIPVLKEMDVDTVNICFDADAVSNPQVRQHLMECAKQLKIDGFRANLIIWNADEGKGIDDLFLSHRLPHIKKMF